MLKKLSLSSTLSSQRTLLLLGVEVDAAAAPRAHAWSVSWTTCSMGSAKACQSSSEAAFVSVLIVFLTVAQTALTDMVVAAPLQLQQLFANRHWVLLWCRSPLSRARTVGLVLVYKYYYSNSF